MKRPEPPPTEMLLQHQRTKEEIQRIREAYNQFEEQRRKDHREFRLAHGDQEGYIHPCT